ncbi:MAG: hypothetical protein MZV64_17300 [Ignavibacteriales bacterium]|nr:hypothetical protein [Ignavibacteriales bacterium]
MTMQTASTSDAGHWSRPIGIRQQFGDLHPRLTRVHTDHILEHFSGARLDLPALILRLVDDPAGHLP